MYSVVKRDGSIIEFDKWKISEAMQKAFDALEPKLEELDEMMGEVIGNFRRGLYTLAYSLAHWVFRTFYFFAGRIKTAICFDSYIAVRLAVVDLKKTFFAKHGVAVFLSFHTGSYLDHIETAAARLL